MLVGRCPPFWVCSSVGVQQRLCAKQREESGDILDPACDRGANGAWALNMDIGEDMVLGRQSRSGVDYCVITYSECGYRESGATHVASARQGAFSQKKPLLGKQSSCSVV